MALVEMVMPKMGESIMEATVLGWLKQEGEEIEADESVLEVATDKVDTEVPATHGGVLKQILVNDGDVVPVGAPICVIATGGDDDQPAATPAAVPAEASSSNGAATAVAVAATATTSSNGSNGATTTLAKPESDRFYSPLVLSIARTEGIGMAELDRVPGTGQNGRVTKKDILGFLQTRGTGVEVAAPAAPSPAAKPAPKPAAPAPAGEWPLHAKPVVPAVAGPGDEIEEMDRMRRMIADRMVDSKRVSPHVTSFVEADVTDLVFWRNRNKQEFKAKENGNLTFTPIFIEAVVKAMKDYPNMNVSVDGYNIIKRKDINIGMAVALPSGNLIVPVIKNADELSLVGIAKRVNDMAKRARDNKLSPDELAGGTFTVSNVGSFGNVMGTPIIMQPQVGILALGAIQKKPSVLETPTGDVIAIRHKMFLSHSYDHRVVDGSLGGMFVRRVADYLERFSLDRSLY